jgi:hypothetical protein
MTMKTTALGRASLGLVMALASGLGSCKEDKPCDQNEVFRDGYCWPADAGAAADFGTTCTTTAECGGPTSYCAVQPGQSSGFCTTFGCDQTPSVCPATWACMDLTPYGLAAHMCVPNLPSDAGPTADVGPAPEAGPTGEAGEAFGKPCAATAECIVPTSYCAVQPGQTSGFCTTFGCDQNPSACPGTWTCMDMTPFGLAGHMCIPST